MTNLQLLYRTLYQYQNFQERVDTMISTLKSSVNSLESADSSLKNSYTYNDESADKGKILKSKSEINGLINSLNNEILPAIKQKIKKIKDDIEEAEAKALALK